MPVPNSAGKGLSRQSLQQLRAICQVSLRKYDALNPESDHPVAKSNRQAEIDMLGRLIIEIDQELANPRTTVLSFSKFAPKEREVPALIVRCEVNSEGELVGYSCNPFDGSESGKTAAAVASYKLGLQVGDEIVASIRKTEGGSRA